MKTGVKGFKKLLNTKVYFSQNNNLSHSSLGGQYIGHIGRGGVAQGAIHQVATRAPFVFMIRTSDYHFRALLNLTLILSRIQCILKICHIER